MDEDRLNQLVSDAVEPRGSPTRPSCPKRTTKQQPSLVFTLPISCQICLSKVKDPVICSNRHAFCKHCMDVWLERNAQCPACRVQVSEANPCQSILGGLSVGDDDDVEDPSASSSSSSSYQRRAGLRRARLELLFNEYEEEIADLRAEVEESKAEKRRLEEELSRCGSASVEAAAAAAPRDPQTSAVLVGLTAKLQEANETYQSVLKDMDALKRENERLKGIRENLEMESSRLRSRLELRSPAKMGRYATVAMETEVASARREADRLKKALELADTNLEKLQRENEHLSSFHKFCKEDSCPLRSTSNLQETRRKTTLDDPFPSKDLVIFANSFRSDSRPPTSSSDSPSSSLRLLSLRSPIGSSTAPSAKPSGAVRTLFPLADRSTAPLAAKHSGADFSIPSDAAAWGEEEESAVDETLEPEIRECLTLIRAAERNVRSRRESGSRDGAAGAAAPAARATSAASSAAETDSTGVSLAYSSSSSTTGAAAASAAASRSFSLPVDADILTPRCSLKREISQGELAANKTAKI